MDSRHPTDLRADVAIVGAGPAGMTAAIAAAETGRRVVLIDRMDRCGVKLLATGGGRCNLTNTASAADFLAAFGRQGRFAQPAMDRLDGEALRAWLASLGVPTFVVSGRQVYPRSESAADVRDALLRRCRELGVRLLLGRRAAAICREGGQVVGLRAGAEDVACGRVVLAAGGRSYPQLGSDGSGFLLAKEVGHTIVEPSPALVPLVARWGDGTGRGAGGVRWPAALAGVSLRDARVWIDARGESRRGVRGDVLFTHDGLSGPAVLNLSGRVAEKLLRADPVVLRLAPSPDVAERDWSNRLDAWGHASGARSVQSLLAEGMPAAFAEAACGLAGVPFPARVAQLGRPQRDRLAGLLAGIPLAVAGTGGFEKSMVTRGGVSLKEVDPRSLESRRVPGLYFAGEVLDLDGPCGGYNLQWAFSSGRLAGQSAGRPSGGR